MRATKPLRREILIAFGVLMAGAVAVAAIGLAFLLPLVTSPARIALIVVIFVTGDLALLAILGSSLLKERLVKPMERLAADARRIADGDYRHRIGALDSLELAEMGESVNAMADSLITDRVLLAENVASLDQTNEDLVEARDEVLHAARLASVGTLAAGIAHEVGNPLGAIMAFVDVARSRAQAKGEDTELLESIRGEATRIDRIVRGLLDYARPRQEEPEPVEPGDVVHRVRELLDSQGKLDQASWEWLVTEDVPRVVMEAHRLEQVLVNLLLNALDALEGTPEPRIEVRVSVEEGGVAKMPRRRAEDPPGINYMHRRRVSRDDGGRGVDPLFTARNVVVIEVSDNGPGIPEEDRETVFDPFFTTKEPGKGTGLGLSICARLVEGMGGRIEAAESELGGARFAIRFPAHAEERE